MKAYNTTLDKMINVLFQTNLEFEGNIDFKTIEQKRNYVNFTLRPISTNKPGYKVSMNGRKISACCFHVHYKFMLEFFRLNQKRKLTSWLENYENYWDFKHKYHKVGQINIGSQVKPFYFYLACNCDNYVYEKL